MFVDNKEIERQHARMLDKPRSIQTQIRFQMRLFIRLIIRIYACVYTYTYICIMYIPKYPNGKYPSEFLYNLSDFFEKHRDKSILLLREIDLIVYSFILS